MKNIKLPNVLMILLLIVSASLSLEAHSVRDSSKEQTDTIKLECFTQEEVFILYDWYATALYPDSIIQAGKVAFTNCNDYIKQQDSTMMYIRRQVKIMEALWLVAEEQNQAKDEHISIQDEIITTKSKDKWYWGLGGTALGIILGALLIR